MTARTMPPIIFPLLSYTEMWSHDLIYYNSFEMISKCLFRVIINNLTNNWTYFIYRVLGTHCQALLCWVILAQKYLKEVFNLSDYLMGNHKYLLIKNNFWSLYKVWQTFYFFVCLDFYVFVLSSIFLTPLDLSQNKRKLISCILRELNMKTISTYIYTYITEVRVLPIWYIWEDIQGERCWKIKPCIQEV